MAGPILGPVLGGVITDLASWRWIFVLNLPLGAIAMAGLGHVPATGELSRETRIDGLGILLLVIGVGSLQLSLERSIGQTLASLARDNGRSDYRRPRLVSHCSQKPPRAVLVISI
jgi:DHA2 family multidrug resistance protein